MKKFKTEIKWALIFSLAKLAWITLEKSLGWHDVNISKQSFYSLLFGFIAVAIYFMASIEKRRKVFKNETFTWQNGFVSGIILTGFIAVLTPITQLIALHYISPNFLENMIAYNVDHLGMSAKNVNTFYSTKMFIILEIFNVLGMGIGTAALIALLTKKKK
ncbi:DUF4199 domain-containing protein [Zunongwangia sp.]|uniref:DUF4199 domain-containing protein n=1 Tax=Zunongwangia sp. TaxID=1965325 RepID=UPI003AA8BA49